jgi:hypothetical protein
MTKGIVLLALGKPEYYQMAAHMAMSLKYHSPEYQVYLLSDGKEHAYIPLPYLQFFDLYWRMHPDDYMNPANGKLNPGKAKLSIPKYVQFDQTVYLDVDGLCIAPIDILFSPEQFVAAEMVGKGGIKDDIRYAIWANNQNTWKHFELPEDAIFRTVQTSYISYRKSAELDTFYGLCMKYKDFPIELMNFKWGGQVADELIFSGVAAKMNHDFNCGFSPIYYGSQYFTREIEEIKAKHCILSMYGNGNGTTLVKPLYKDMYNRICQNMCRHFKIERIFPIEYLMRSKHANLR